MSEIWVANFALGDMYTRPGNTIRICPYFVFVYVQIVKTLLYNILFNC